MNIAEEIRRPISTADPGRRAIIYLRRERLLAAISGEDPIRLPETFEVRDLWEDRIRDGYVLRVWSLELPVVPEGTMAPLLDLREYEQPGGKLVEIRLDRLYGDPLLWTRTIEEEQR